MKKMHWRFGAPAAVAALALGTGGVALAAQDERPARPADQQAVNVEAEVERLTRSPSGKVSGLRLDNGTLVKAARHAIRRDLHPLVGRTVQAEGWLKSARIHHATITQDGRTIAEGHTPRRGAPEDEDRVEVTGTVRDVTTGRRGEANGIVLDDGNRVSVPRDVDARELIGREVTVSGYLKSAEIKEATVTRGDVTYIADEGRRGPRDGGPRGSRGEEPAPPSDGGPRGSRGEEPAPPSDGGPRGPDRRGPGPR